MKHLAKFRVSALLYIACTLFVEQGAAQPGKTPSEETPSRETPSGETPSSDIKSGLKKDGNTEGGDLWQALIAEADNALAEPEQSQRFTALSSVISGQLPAKPSLKEIKPAFNALISEFFGTTLQLLPEAQYRGPLDYALGEKVQRHFFGLAVKSNAGGWAVTQVLGNSAADRAGLKPGDRLTHYAAESFGKLSGNLSKEPFQGQTYLNANKVNLTIQRLGLVDPVVTTLQITPRSFGDLLLADTKASFAVLASKKRVFLRPWFGGSPSEQQAMNEEIIRAIGRTKIIGGTLVLDLRGDLDLDGLDHLSKLLPSFPSTGLQYRLIVDQTSSPARTKLAAFLHRELGAKMFGATKGRTATKLGFLKIKDYPVYLKIPTDSTQQKLLSLGEVNTKGDPLEMALYGS